MNAASSSTAVPDFGAGSVIFDESTDGDLADRTTPTPVTLGSPTDIIIGNVGGADFDDCANFSIPTGNSITAIVLSNYVPDGGNVTSGFNIYAGIPVDPAVLGDVVSIAVGLQTSEMIF